MQAKLEKKQIEDICAFIDNSIATKHDIELVRKDIEMIRSELKKDIKFLMIIGSIFGSMIPIGFTILGLLMISH